MDQVQEQKQGGGAGGHAVEVIVHVNEKPVRLAARAMTGLAIKQAAIAQGVPDIQLNFVLLKELGGGRTDVVGDTDIVHVNDKTRFACVHPDDNS